MVCILEFVDLSPNHSLSLPGLPAACETSSPQAWQWSGDRLVANAGPGDNLFISPITRKSDLSAPVLRFPVEGDFLLSARVEVHFRETFDAAALINGREEGIWAKLCLEFSPEHQPMVVSVVTRGTSDDANCLVHPRPWIYLRIARIGEGFAFHYSVANSSPWQLVRAFTLDSAAPLWAGFLIQSPRGSGCEGEFSDIRWDPATLNELRSGE